MPSAKASLSIYKKARFHLKVYHSESTRSDRRYIKWTTKKPSFGRLWMHCNNEKNTKHPFYCWYFCSRLNSWILINIYRMVRRLKSILDLCAFRSPLSKRADVRSSTLVHKLLVSVLDLIIQLCLFTREISMRFF